MIYLTIINTLPVKKKMKNAFYENHIFTRFNLLIAALVGAFSVIVKTDCETDGSSAALGHPGRGRGHRNLPRGQTLQSQHRLPGPATVAAACGLTNFIIHPAPFPPRTTVIILHYFRY